ncbi:hypothetical protein [Shimia aestuarii]|uniref:Uncharacterized protein n=1 Tax=Shimia aestuarii TaxID=254406 RepID=A0A1I4PYS9_9RHOB|nr:hypothetical protein [Shimia aestuarii]SFM32766.1 hypothetical protein SAMN04488042_106102 [Shimia aestuarii]
MTNIIAHLKGGPNDVTHRDGMQKAGEEINLWMDDPDNDAEDFFDDLFASLKNTHEFRIERDGLEPEIMKQGNKYKFNDGANDYFLRVKCEEDADWESNGKKNVRMTIPIPQARDDLTGGGYTEKMVQHLRHFLCDEDDDQKAKEYLLAVIFLNRCQ